MAGGGKAEAVMLDGTAEERGALDEATSTAMVLLGEGELQLTNILELGPECCLAYEIGIASIITHLVSCPVFGKPNIRPSGWCEPLVTSYLGVLLVD